MLFELIFTIKSLVAHVAVEWSFVYHTVLNEIRSRSKTLVTHCAGIRPVTEMQILMLHQNMLIAKAPITDIALIWLFSHVRQSYMAY
jgi:hypothetical protein